jgi:hypothetical protein
MAACSRNGVIATLTETLILDSGKEGKAVAAGMVL